MRVWQPYKAYPPSVQCLDNARLHAQVNECFTILRALVAIRDGDPGRSGGYGYVPATTRWVGSESNLVIYAMLAAGEYRRRRHSLDEENVMTPEDLLEVSQEDDRGLRISKEFLPIFGSEWRPLPWDGDPWYHRAERSALVRKNRDRYGPMFPMTPELMPDLYPFLSDDDPRGFRLFVCRPELQRLKEGHRVLPPQLKLDLITREVTEA